MDLDEKLLELLDKSIYSDEVFKLIDLGANPNILNHSGYSLLHILIFNNRMDDTYKLLENDKVNINIKDKYGFPPLHYMLNVNYSLDDLMNLIKLGANPNVRSKSGMAPIHLFIRSKFKYALELLEKHPECIHYKNSEGTPLQVMLNSRHTQAITADNYLILVRCGADPDSVDKEGISLFKVIVQLGNSERSRELIALSKIAPGERKYFTPALIDYLICEDGIMQLVLDLQKNKISNQDIARIAKFPFAKEQVIQYIKTLEPHEQEPLLKECLSPGSSLNQFFSVQRGWFMTSTKRGTLAQLAGMQKDLINNKIREANPSAEGSDLKPSLMT